ncbi:MAG: class 1b ribonucleoside-diphosphate reductase subunit beta [Alphaproteobacteria bacterium]|jgi:ribonucleoside-diphosphate reductase beta chain|nr:class 1b ribonucleoside-diphosphate reductase subunit beta [Alphaproteobacteria bacterium]
MFNLRKNNTHKEAVNWNNIKDNFTTLFWNQNIRQFWIDEEIPLSDDKLTWITLSDAEKDTYIKVLAGLTLLDTEQGSTGMPQIALHTENLHSKAILSFMGMMEHMHAKSYSSIFSTLCNSKEIEEIFEWVKNHDALQEKLAVITSYYNNINDNKSLYMAMVASVFLESFLFYSGFFYPLYLAGQGKLVASGEIINLIIRDESIHGVYVGILAQELFVKLSAEEQAQIHQETALLLKNLYDIEVSYASGLYTKIGLFEDVKTFIAYNADKALMNLGLEPHFNIDASEVNASVLRGLDTKTKNHDFFSTKGNGYIKTTNVDKLSDDDFNF